MRKKIEETFECGKQGRTWDKERMNRDSLYVYEYRWGTSWWKCSLVDDSLDLLLVPSIWAKKMCLDFLASKKRNANLQKANFLILRMLQNASIEPLKNSISFLIGNIEAKKINLSLYIHWLSRTLSEKYEGFFQNFQSEKMTNGKKSWFSQIFNLKNDQW